MRADYKNWVPKGMMTGFAAGAGAMAAASACLGAFGKSRGTRALSALTGLGAAGCDAWGPEYASFSQEVCEQNAKAEGVENVSFQPGNAKKLPFADESFDVVTSNYVYHNVMGADKQKLLRETLRTLKRGGTFAIHDIMSEQRYGDMRKFCDELRAEGYEKVELIDTTNGLFMSRAEAATLFLTGSAVLCGKK